jgi:hypothetical protein
MNELNKSEEMAKKVKNMSRYLKFYSYVCEAVTFFTLSGKFTRASAASEENWAKCKRAKVCNEVPQTVKSSKKKSLLRTNV